jgi:hypothetical protein
MLTDEAHCRHRFVTRVNQLADPLEALDGKAFDHLLHRILAAERLLFRGYPPGELVSDARSAPSGYHSTVDLLVQEAIDSPHELAVVFEWPVLRYQRLGIELRLSAIDRTLISRFVPAGRGGCAQRDQNEYG